MNGYNFTERVRKVLAMAREEAARLHHEYVGTEHILLGLIREGEGVAATVLQNLSSELDEIHQKIEETAKPPALDPFCRDLTQLAAEGQLDPTIGRAKEIERVMEVLTRRKKNNPVLIGEPGVGKTAIVEGLAQLIANRQGPER